MPRIELGPKMCVRGHASTSWHPVETEKPVDCDDSTHFLRITPSKTYWLNQLLWNNTTVTLARTESIKAGIAEVLKAWTIKDQQCRSVDAKPIEVTEVGDFVRKADSSDEDVAGPTPNDNRDDDDANGKVRSGKKLSGSTPMLSVRVVKMRGAEFKVRPFGRTSVLIEAEAHAVHTFVEMVTMAQKAVSESIHPDGDETLPGVEPEEYVGCEDSNRLKWNRNKCCWQITYKDASGKWKTSSAPFKVNLKTVRTQEGLIKLVKTKLNAARTAWNKVDKSSASRYLMTKSTK